MIKIYGIPNCNTVKMAQNWFNSHNLNYTFHNYKKDGVDGMILDRFFQVFGWEQVLNRKGLTFKKLDLTERSRITDAASAKAYLLNNASAIKRPIITVNDTPLLIGFDDQEYAKQLK